MSLHRALRYKLTSSEPGPFADTINAMRDRGVKLIYGRWLIEGAPRVLLFDTGSCYDRSANASMCFETS
jgi:glycogen(starch) synthase